MRPIDADALPMYEELFMNGINNSGVWVRYRDVENLIRNAPTIEERKKGKWYLRDITRYGGKPYICTVCGREANDVYHFCPRCGADMREEKTDE